MRIVRLLQPQKIFFGAACAEKCVEDLLSLGYRRVFIVTSPPILNLVEPLVNDLKARGAWTSVHAEIGSEPSIASFEGAHSAAQAAEPDAVLGIGGGAMDTAKLVAALYAGQQNIRDVLGIELLKARPLHLACLPTTAGTGSEVSPNAILGDEEEGLKKGVVSPYLVPDAAYIDPLLMLSMPAEVTAATGLDALTQCIEAYANRFAHPLVDLYTLEGVRLISTHLLRAVQNGEDLEARTHMAMGSLYGGLCLSPVNTAAVHALAYPLGGEYHIPHGVSNAVLLPHVLRFNLVAAPERYAEIGRALGVEPGDSTLATAERGLERIAELCRQCGIPSGLAELGIPEAALPGLVQSAMKVTRLLKNNLRELTTRDAEAIYRAVF